MTEITKIEAMQKAALQAAAAYEWEEARNLFTKALDGPDIPPEIEYELRMGRTFDTVSVKARALWRSISCLRCVDNGSRMMGFIRTRICY